jgi:DNA-binding FadR family transcriptional regulator
MIVMPRRLSDEIASRVRALIEEQQLEAGMKLPAERQLAAQLGCRAIHCAKRWPRWLVKACC